MLRNSIDDFYLRRRVNDIDCSEITGFDFDQGLESRLTLTKFKPQTVRIDTFDAQRFHPAPSPIHAELWDSSQIRGLDENDHEVFRHEREVCASGRSHVDNATHSTFVHSDVDDSDFANFERGITFDEETMKLMAEGIHIRSEIEKRCGPDQHYT